MVPSPCRLSLTYLILKMSDKFGKAEEKKKKRSTVLFLMTTLEICFVFEQKRWPHALIR